MVLPRSQQSSKPHRMPILLWPFRVEDDKPCCRLSRDRKTVAPKAQWHAQAVAGHHLVRTKDLVEVHEGARSRVVLHCLAEGALQVWMPILCWPSRIKGKLAEMNPRPFRLIRLGQSSLVKVQTVPMRAATVPVMACSGLARRRLWVGALASPPLAARVLS